MMVDKSTCKSQTVDQTVSPTAKIGIDPKVADSWCAINDPRKGKNNSDRVTCYQQPIHADTTDGSHANVGSTGQTQIVNQT